jgi:mannosylglucosylglycerate synthase
MRIGFIATRLAGTDGVSLETTKLATVLRRQGHEVFYCAGELDGDVPGLLAPEAHFTDPVAVALGARAFGATPDLGLLRDISARARELVEPLEEFVQRFAIDYLIVQNAFAIPMQLSLAQAIVAVLGERDLPGLAHNHDLYWERERFAVNQIAGFLDTYFPPALPRLQHATINTLAQRALRQRRGLESVVIPNVFDFATPPPGIDDFNRDFREVIGLTDEQWLILQPTRVIPRKGIELAVELVAQLKDPRAVLVISHEAGDEGMDYLDELQALAAAQNVGLRYIAARIGDRRGEDNAGRKIYSLWDAYAHADLVTYPSLIEGFGNALLETVYFRLPALVNRYAVYVADIAPLGFTFAEIEGAIAPQAVAQVRGWLEDPGSAEPFVEHNYRLAARHFSYEALDRVLSNLLANVS